MLQDRDGSLTLLEHLCAETHEAPEELGLQAQKVSHWSNQAAICSAGMAGRLSFSNGTRVRSRGLFLEERS